MKNGKTKLVSIDSEVVIKILSQSPQGFTPIAILDHLLAQPQYQGRSRPSLFSKLLTKLKILHDSQVVTRISRRWILVESLNSASTERDKELPKVVTINQHDTSTDSKTAFEPNQLTETSQPNIQIEILNLPFRPYTCLKRTGINTLQELQSYSDQQLLGIKNFGQNSLTEVQTALTKFSASLQSEEVARTALPAVNKSQPETSQAEDSYLDSPIEILSLSTRAFHCLKRAGINTIRELQSCPDEDLLKIKYFGQSSLAQIKSALRRFHPVLESPQNQEFSLLPIWARSPALQIPTRCLSISPTWRFLVNKYSVVFQLMSAFEAGHITSDYRQYAEIKEVLVPFQALRNASTGYLDWLSSLSWLTLIKILTKYHWTQDKLGNLSPLSILSALPKCDYKTTLSALTSGKIPSKTFSTIAEEVNDYFSILDERQQFVLKQRLGLQNGNKVILEDIGKELGITRETVRQITNKAKKKLLVLHNHNCLLQLKEVAIDTLRSASCISTFTDFAEKIALSYPPGDIYLPSAISLLTEINLEINVILIDQTRFVYISPLSKQILVEIKSKLYKFLTEKIISDRCELHELILPLLPQDILAPEQVVDTLINSICHQDIPGIFSIQAWNIADYAYYVLYQAKKPLHFQEIGKRVKKLKSDWQTENTNRGAQAAIERHPGIIRCGRGIYTLRNRGTIEYSHFREVLANYLSKQPLPLDAEKIYLELNELYRVSRATVTRNLHGYPHLFQRFGSSNIYGITGKQYELPNQQLIDLLVTKLKVKALSLDTLVLDENLKGYDTQTIELYLNASPLFRQVNQSKKGKFTLVSNK
ncbi:MAG: DNA-directed RNA polymerase subunit alpha C-terminal domain-containing protein [Coleofasciculaceae cyanobacterium]